MSFREMAKKCNIDPMTAKRYAQSDTKPNYDLTAPKPSILDEYTKQIDVWPEEAPYSAVRIHEKLTELGFEGGYSIVKRYVHTKKNELDEKATVRFETMPGLQAQADWAFSRIIGH
jgi:transposase